MTTWQDVAREVRAATAATDPPGMVGVDGAGLGDGGVYATGESQFGPGARVLARGMPGKVDHVNNDGTVCVVHDTGLIATYLPEEVKTA